MGPVGSVCVFCDATRHLPLFCLCEEKRGVKGGGIIINISMAPTLLVSWAPFIPFRYKEKQEKGLFSIDLLLVFFVVFGGVSGCRALDL